LDVCGEAHLSASAGEPVVPCRGSPHDLARPRRPLFERIFVDAEPNLLDAALDLLFGADQSCHVLIASSIFVYVPQRQRFPAMRWRISAFVGSACASTSATALTICPGVQKPHCTASARTNESIIGWSRSPSIV